MIGYRKKTSSMPACLFFNIKFEATLLPLLLAGFRLISARNSGDWRNTPAKLVGVDHHRAQEIHGAHDSYQPTFRRDKKAMDICFH